MDLELSGKRALVTGGSRGIGKAVAMELAREGADVAIAARDRARIDATVAEITSASGRKIFGTTLDAADGDSIREMVRRHSVASTFSSMLPPARVANSPRPAGTG